MPGKGPCKEELLESIKPGMKLTKDFFKRIYGYEISFPGFADKAIAALEVAGCSHARQYFDDLVAAYEEEHNAMMKSVAEWYKKQNFYRKEVRQPRKRQEAEQSNKKPSRQQNWETLSRMLGYQSAETEK